ncbi:MAG: biotin--[acetyl-CoA-carboxylase] ligase [Clostridia bacterium]|nr:biotin--[acetyl-CoA-carboxylase] ligase [Clostridia bacterium]
MKIIELKEVDSTNEYCKRQNFSEDVAVIALRQTAGKGTKGRSFISEEGGLYVTTVRHYKNLPAENAFHIMINSCVAVCRTLEYFNITPVIRWANDVLVNGKKICGTLIENTFSNGYITRSIVGMGINVNNGISPKLKDIAVSMKEILGKSLDLEEVKSVFLQNLEKNYEISDYKRYINWFNRQIILKTDENERVATALDISENGRLLVDWCGNMLEISSAEVSLRL